MSLNIESGLFLRHPQLSHRDMVRRNVFRDGEFLAVEFDKLSFDSAGHDGGQRRSAHTLDSTAVDICCPEDPSIDYGILEADYAFE